MIQHWIVVGMAALVLARPETYKENEEFNYARSSTDEGSKAGFYEAQRGNMGGNYERAHNMDHVAQGQMSDIVNQVGTRVDEVADSKQGDVFGSAYTRGVYGQRRYDTANLAGRNFQENTYGGHGSSSSASSATSGSVDSRYRQYGGSSQARLTDNLNTGSSLQQTNSAYGSGTARGTGSSYASGSSYGSGSRYASSQHSTSSGYQQYDGSNQHSTSNSELYDQNRINSDLSHQYRIVPVRVVVRPLTPVRVPVKAVAHDQIVDSAYRQANEQESRTHSQNSLTQTTGNVRNGGSNAGGINGEGKHYESSYDYHKNWEKHSEVTPVPLSVPASNHLSEPLSSYNQEQDRLYNRQNQYTREQSSNSQSNAASNSRFATTNLETAALNQQASLHERGYQSGHQYQRVAEPISSNRYVVISPTPEFVVTGTKQGAYRGSNSQQSSGYSAGSRSESHSAYGAESLAQDHLRTNNDNLLTASNHNHDALMAITGASANSGSATEPKKYESSYSYRKSWERQGDPYIIQPASSGSVSGQSEKLQTSPNQGYGSHNSPYSRAQSSNSHSAQADCCIQRYTRSARYGYGGQQMQASSQAQEVQEDLGQQTQDFVQQTQDLTEQSEELTQQTKYLGQQTEDLGQKTEDLGQQTEDLGQQTEDLDQQTQDFHQKAQLSQETGQQRVESSGPGVQGQHPYRASTSRLEDLGDRVESNQGQQIQVQAGISKEDLGQQVQDGWGDKENLEQQVHSGWDQAQVGQEAQGIWNSNDHTQHTLKAARDLTETDLERNDTHHRHSFLQSGYEKHFEQQDENSQHSFAHTEDLSQKTEDLGQQTQDFHQQAQLSQERQHSWEQRNFQDQSYQYGYHVAHGMQSDWKQYGHEQNVNQGREQENNGNLYRHEHGMPAFWMPSRNLENNKETEQEDNQRAVNNGYGYHNRHNYHDRTAANSGNTGEHENYNIHNNERTNRGYGYRHRHEYHDRTTIHSENTGEQENQEHNVSTTEQENYNKNERANRGYGYRHTHNYYDRTIVNPGHTVEHNDNTTKEENKNVNDNGKVQSNDETNAGTILRGDLGTEKPVENPTSSTPKSLTSEEYDKFLKDLLSSVNINKDNKNNNSESPRYAIFTSTSNKEKTSEEIEGLSLTRDSEKPSNNKPNSGSSSVQSGYVDRNQIHNSQQWDQNIDNINQHTESNEKIENVGQELERFNKQLEHRLENGGYANHQTDNLGSNNNQHFGNIGQGLESFGNSKENDQHRQDSVSMYNQQVENIGQMIENGHSDSSNLQQESEDNSKLFNGNSYQHTLNVNQNTQDIDTVIRDLTNGLHNRSSDVLTVKPLHSSQRVTTEPNGLMQKPSYYGSDKPNVKEQSNNQQMENLGQQVENFDQMPDEMVQETINLDQQSTVFGQEIENYKKEAGQETYMGQQSGYVGQQAESLNKNVERLPESGQHSEDLGQQTEDFGQQSENLGQQMEDLKQQSEDLGQQTVELGQQSEDFGQQAQNFEQQSENLGQQMEDLKQQSEGFGQQIQNIEQQEQSFHKVDKKPKSELDQPAEIGQQRENLATARHYGSLDQKPTDSDKKVIGLDENKGANSPSVAEAPVETPAVVEVSTSTPTESESPGFWKKVGSKFTSAKDKVSCWFQTCT